MTPLTAHLAASAVSGLPAGAIFDSTTQNLHWLPQKGQAGSYQISVDGSPMTLAVNQVPSLQQGPPTYRDGEIGFVYVHGLSTENYCANPMGLANYWQTTPAVLSPDANLRTLSCYDGTQAVEASALIVAQQILEAPCGPYNKCVVVAHSMGNLIMEYILTHDRAATALDPEPQLFANAALFAQVKSKVLFVISLASAAGGSKAANILNDPGSANLIQGATGVFAGFFGSNTPATRSLVVERASTILAPFTADPGVPFFMVAGYTTQTMGEYGVVSGIFNHPPQTVYNADSRYAQLDPVIRFNSRSDGMVDFRSACGIASPWVNEGPGYGSSLLSHFTYCLIGQRKPNHYLWFMTNLNHSLIAAPWAGCFNSSNPCISWFPNSSGTAFDLDGGSLYKSSIDVIRARMFK